MTRDEIVQALRVAIQILEAFPDSQYSATDAPTKLLEPLGAFRGNNMKGIPQPPRKRHALAPDVHLDAVDWTGIPRAARRIAEALQAHGPATSHELMSRLGIARPTFNNAMSTLRAKGLVMSAGLHESAA